MKVKMFPILSLQSGEQTINRWLEQNTNISVVSVNTIPNYSAYIILYEEKDIGNDADEVD